MPRYICETTIGAIFIGEKTQMINLYNVYWDLSDMPMIIYYIYKPSSRLFDMLGVGGGGTGIVHAQNRECGLQKVILDLLSHVCTARPRRGESLMEIAPQVSVWI